MRALLSNRSSHFKKWPRGRNLLALGRAPRRLVGWCMNPCKPIYSGRVTGGDSPGGEVQSAPSRWMMDVLIDTDVILTLRVETMTWMTRVQVVVSVIGVDSGRRGRRSLRWKQRALLPSFMSVTCQLRAAAPSDLYGAIQVRGILLGGNLRTKYRY
jgi:hypothetical protein